jgi:SAM-dependent methyltransferase
VDNATNLPAVYEGLGWFYDRYWRGLVSKAMPGLDRLVLSQLPRHSRVLDLCCGTGHICSALARRGFRVTGLDESEDMLRFARENAPGCDFVAADMRNFSFPGCFNAVLSTFDSMNHLLSLKDLKLALLSVHGALAKGGLLVFDLNMAEAFIKQWRKSSTIAAQDHLCYVRGAYESETKLGVTEITTFRFNGEWMRQDIKIYQRCYASADVRRALIDSGFTKVTAYSAKSLGMRGRLSVGRTYFAAVK